MRLRKISGRRQISLAKQDKHLCGSNLRNPIHEIMLACGLISLGEDSGRASHVSLREHQPGKKHFTENGSVSVYYLPRQRDAQLRVLFGSILVVPLVEYASQAEMRIAGRWGRRITSQLQGASVGLNCQREVVFCFLYCAQADCSHHGDDGTPDRLAGGQGFGIGLPGRGTVSLEVIGISHLPCNASAFG